jgi:hypothetical protein
MTSEAARLKEHLKRVGEVKAASHREATAAHLALPMGERLTRAVQLSDSMLRLFREARLGRERTHDDEADMWRRVNEHLQGLPRG